MRVENTGPVDPAVGREDGGARGAGHQGLPGEGPGAVGGVPGQSGQAGQAPPGGVAGGQDLYTGTGTSHTLAAYNCGDTVSVNQEIKITVQAHPASRRCCGQEEQGL